MSWVFIPSPQKAEGLINLSLFSGAGGLDLGAKLVGGFTTAVYVERDRYAQGVLMSRMRDGGLDMGAIYDDVTTFDGTPWRGRVDVISGGFPCQDVSRSGKRVGLTGKRSGLYEQFMRIVGEVEPRFVLVENVPGLHFRGGTGVVLGRLAELGYDAEWDTWSACGFGAPHMRRRVFIVAHARHLCSGDAAPVETRRADFGDELPTASVRKEMWNLHRSWCGHSRAPRGGGAASWPGEPRIDRVVNGMAFQMDRIRLTGNGVVPVQSSRAWQKIKDLAGVK